MASSLECDLCKQEQAVLLQSNLGTGDTIAVGGHCLRDFYANGLAAINAALSDAAGTGTQGGAEDQGTPENPPADGTEPHRPHVAPMDAYVADRKAIAEADPDGTYPPGTHLHDCPVKGNYLDKHEGGSKPHEHECTHADSQVNGG